MNVRGPTLFLLLAIPAATLIATALLADEPDIGTGSDPRSPLHAALEALGEPFASEMAKDAELPL